MKKIIIIEDDIFLREELSHTFKKRGYLVSSISSFTAPGKEILSYEPDLVLLDLNLPETSGFELCKWLKSHAAFPILVLTARDTLSDELQALELGADDFLTKPCHPDRLLARAEKLLQHYGKVHNLIQNGNLILDLDTYKVIWQNAHTVLPQTEGKILQILLEHYPLVVSKQDLVTLIWGSNNYVDENILQVNLTRLRKNLAAIGLNDIIETIRGRGYCLKVIPA